MKKILFLLVSMVIFMGGCGGGESVSIGVNGQQGGKVGRFYEVEGLGYKTTSGIESVTGRNSEFSYNDGDNIEFFIGDLYLGKTKAKEFLTPFDLNNSEKIVQILHTVDYDLTPANGIQISEKVSKLSKNYDFRIDEFTQDSEFDNLLFYQITKENKYGSTYIIDKNDAVIQSLKNYYAEALKMRKKQKRSRANPTAEELGIKEKSDEYLDAIATYALNEINYYDWYNQEILENDIAKRVKLAIYQHYYYDVSTNQYMMFHNQTLATEEIHDTLMLLTTIVSGVASIRSLNSYAKAINKNSFNDSYNAIMGYNPIGILSKTDELHISTAASLGAMEVAIMPEVGEDISKTLGEGTTNAFLGNVFNSIGAVTSIPGLLAYSAQIYTDFRASWEISNTLNDWNSYLVSDFLLKKYYYSGGREVGLYLDDDLINKTANEELAAENSIWKKAWENLWGESFHNSNYSLEKVRKYYNNGIKNINIVYNHYDNLFDFEGTFLVKTIPDRIRILKEISISLVDGNSDYAILKGKDNRDIKQCFKIKNNSYISFDNLLFSLDFNNESVEIDDVIKLDRQDDIVHCFSFKNVDKDILRDIANSHDVYDFVRYSVSLQEDTHQEAYAKFDYGLRVKETSEYTEAHRPLIFETVDYVLNAENNYLRLIVVAHAGSDEGELTYSWEQLVPDPDTTLINYSTYNYNQIILDLPEMKFGQKQQNIKYKVTVSSEKGSKKEKIFRLAINNTKDRFSLELLSESGPKDYEVLSNNQTYQKIWRVKNTSSFDLSNVYIKDLDSKFIHNPQDDGITPNYIQTWRQGEVKEFKTTIKTPKNSSQTIHDHSWYITANNGKYPILHTLNPEHHFRKAKLSYSYQTVKSGTIVDDTVQPNITYTISGKVIREDGKAISGVPVQFFYTTDSTKKSITSKTGADGKYSLKLTDSQFKNGFDIVYASTYNNSYKPQSKGINKKTTVKKYTVDFVLVPSKNSDVVIDKDINDIQQVVTHLGDNNFDGGVNAQIPKDATTTETTLYFDISADQYNNYKKAELSYLAQGVERSSDQIIINDTKHSMRLNSNSAYKKFTIAISKSEYHIGVNSLQVVSAQNSSKDFDDFRFTNIQITFLDPINNSSNNSDNDSDGLSNEKEILYNTDPNNPDTDGDGLSDGYEVQNGSNPLISEDYTDSNSDSYLDSILDSIDLQEQPQQRPLSLVTTNFWQSHSSGVYRASCTEWERIIDSGFTLYNDNGRDVYIEKIALAVHHDNDSAAFIFDMYVKDVYSTLTRGHSISIESGAGLKKVGNYFIAAKAYYEGHWHLEGYKRIKIIENDSCTVDNNYVDNQEGENFYNPADVTVSNDYDNYDSYHNLPDLAEDSGGGSSSNFYNPATVTVGGQER